MIYPSSSCHSEARSAVRIALLSHSTTMRSLRRFAPQDDMVLKISSRFTLYTSLRNGLFTFHFSLKYQHLPIFCYVIQNGFCWSFVQQNFLNCGIYQIIYILLVAIYSHNRLNMIKLFCTDNTSFCH